MERARTRPQARSRLPAEVRHRQLAEEAARRFYRLGYHRVALADVANAVGVTAPAVYRHFRNKNALLAAAIDGGLDIVDTAFDGAGDSLPELLHALAGAALARRDLWVLLQREMRHLDGEERERIQARFAALVSRIAARVRAARGRTPDGELALVVTAVLGTLASASVSRLRAPEYQRVLAAAAGAAALADLPGRAPRPRPRAEVPDSLPRSEELLQRAVELFHQRGYSAVSLDDIGAAAGLAGPSIYHHFATKSELLETAFHRAAHALTRHRPGAPVTELARDYIDAGVRRRDLFGVYVTESINLPPGARRRIAATVDASVHQWSVALRARRGELTERQSLLLVHAARGVVNDVVRMPRLHARPNVAEELAAVLRAVLDADF